MEIHELNTFSGTLNDSVFFAVDNGTDTAKIAATKLNEYVTPEMFGAKGDGVTDDTQAIQDAVDNGLWVVCNGTYKTTQSIIIHSDNRLFDGSTATFVYTGANSAFVISNINGGNINIGNVTANNGTCIEFKSITGLSDRTQYVNMCFNRLSASPSDGNAILITVDNDGWSNQNVIRGGEIINGARGVRINRGASHTHDFNQWIFEGVGFEFNQTNAEAAGVIPICIDIINNGSVKTVECLTFESCRYMEYKTTTLIKTQGSVKYCFFRGDFEVDESRLSFDNLYNVRGFEIDAPIVSSGTYLGEGLYVSYGHKHYLSYLYKFEKENINLATVHSSAYIIAKNQGGVATAGYIDTINVGDVVTLNFRNLTMSGNGNIINTGYEIDEKYRPNYEVDFPLVASDGSKVARVYIRTAGTIAVTAVDTAKTYTGTVTFLKDKTSWATE